MKKSVAVHTNPRLLLSLGSLLHLLQIIKQIIVTLSYVISSIYHVPFIALLQPRQVSSLPVPWSLFKFQPNDTRLRPWWIARASGVRRSFHKGLSESSQSKNDQGKGINLPKASAMMRINIIAVNSLGCCAHPRTPASPTIPIANLRLGQSLLHNSPPYLWKARTNTPSGQTRNSN
jgi:hypothetical protein